MIQTFRGRETEYLAQVKLAITHHTVSAGATGTGPDSLVISTDKPLAFVLDQPKQDGKKRKKKAKKNALTATSFGAMVNVSKMKDASRFVIGWRARFPSKNNK